MTNLRASAAVIAGSFADYRLVKSRSVLQVIVEIPIEMQGAAFAALGYPLPGTEIPVAVARMNPPAGNPQPQAQEPTEPPGRRGDKSPAERAVIRAALLPKDERFRAWATQQTSLGHYIQRLYMDEDEAAQFIRKRCCDGNSRSLIAAAPEYLDRFLAMETEFKMDVGELARPR